MTVPSLGEAGVMQGDNRIGYSRRTVRYKQRHEVSAAPVVWYDWVWVRKVRGQASEALERFVPTEMIGPHPAVDGAPEKVICPGFCFRRKVPRVSGGGLTGSWKHGHQLGGSVLGDGRQ